MADDDVDHDLLEFMRQAMTNRTNRVEVRSTPQTNVLSSAEFIVDNAIDVFLSRDHIMAAARYIYQQLRRKHYSTATWSEHELHPKAKDESTVDFIFVMDLLNFSFWSDRKTEAERYTVEYRGKWWTGYWSMVAALQRALDEGIPITNPYFYRDADICPDSLIHHIFRSITSDEMSLIPERIALLRQAGNILCERYDGRFSEMIGDAENSAAALVVDLAGVFEGFRDEHKFEGRRVNFYKRAQILVADVWAAFNGSSYGEFTDIDSLTMFADYRVPVILNTLHCLQYGPKLESHILSKKDIPSGSSWEVQLRGASIWCVEQILRQIKRDHPEAKDVNAVLIDFYLYDTAKEMEAQGHEMVPHHRTRSIWY